MILQMNCKVRIIKYIEICMHKCVLKAINSEIKYITYKIKLLNTIKIQLIVDVSIILHNLHQYAYIITKHTGTKTIKNS